jgi:predicted nucleic acid-binding protein
MAFGRAYLVDTNVLLRLSQHNDPQHRLVQRALDELDKQGADLYFSMQNMAEFWNVCTRPVERNGYGLSGEETRLRAEAIERTMTFLPDNDRAYSIWRQIVLANNVRGVQVHDARLVAVMLAHGLTQILTLNQPDFARYRDLNVIHPSQLQTSAP